MGVQLLKEKRGWKIRKLRPWANSRRWWSTQLHGVILLRIWHVGAGFNWFSFPIRRFGLIRKIAFSRSYAILYGSRFSCYAIRPYLRLLFVNYILGTSVKTSLHEIPTRTTFYPSPRTERCSVTSSSTSWSWCPICTRCGGLGWPPSCSSYGRSASRLTASQRTSSWRMPECGVRPLSPRTSGRCLDRSGWSISFCRRRFSIASLATGCDGKISSLRRIEPLRAEHATLPMTCNHHVCIAAFELGRSSWLGMSTPSIVLSHDTHSFSL